MALKKPSVAARTDSSLNGGVCTFSSLHPSLSEWMTAEVWEDSSKRRLPSLTIFSEDGLVKICVNDKATERVAFVSGPSLREALQSIEDGLTRDSLEWRRSKPVGGRR